MRLLSFWRGLLLGTTGLLVAASAAAQTVPDTIPARLAPWLVKGGLRLTHLSYSRNASSWQLLVPLALGAERRLGSRVSLYAQLDADAQLTSAGPRRRRSATGADTRLPSASLGLGTRYYYGRPTRPTAGRAGPEFGKYLALEAGATLASATAQAVGSGRRQMGSRSVLMPSLYALWGIQNRLRAHLLYDLSAGLGVLAPTRTQAEYFRASHGWDVGAQVNVRLYLAN